LSKCSLEILEHMSTSNMNKKPASG